MGLSFSTIQTYANSAKSLASDLAIKAVPVLNQVTKVAKIAWKAFGLYTLYSMYENALSNIFCLKTYRHGTDPYAFVRIHLEGNDLARGGTGGEARWYEQGLQEKSPYAHRDGGCFYVVEDVIGSEYGSKEIFPFALSYYTTKGTVKYYALRSSISFWGSWLPLPQNARSWITRNLVEMTEYNPHVNQADQVRARALFYLLCPTVKIHLNPDDLPRSERDGFDSHKGKPFEGALRTKHKFSIFDMGILGVLKNGLRGGLLERIQQNRGQCLFGLVQLVAAIALTLYFFPALLPVTVSSKIVFAWTALTQFGQKGYLAEKVANFAQGVLIFPIGIAAFTAVIET